MSKNVVMNGLVFANACALITAVSASGCRPLNGAPDYRETGLEADVAMAKMAVAAKDAVVQAVNRSNRCATGVSNQGKFDRMAFGGQSKSQMIK